jgi:hypothetical protein
MSKIPDRPSKKLPVFDPPLGFQEGSIEGAKILRLLWESQVTAGRLVTLLEPFMHRDPRTRTMVRHARGYFRACQGLRDAICTQNEETTT